MKKMDKELFDKVAGGNEKVVGGKTSLVCPNCGHTQEGNYGTYVLCPACKQSYLVPQK